jgi:hypothetical protein
MGHITQVVANYNFNKYEEGRLKLRWIIQDIDWLIEVVTKAGFTVYYKIFHLFVKTN